MLLKKNRKGQVATTITWVVATIIIIVMLVISVLATTILGRRSYTDKDLDEKIDLFIAKSLLSYLLTQESGKIIFEQISEQGNLDDFNGNLASNIFFGLYEKYYQLIWLGVLKPEITENIYFKKVGALFPGGDYENIVLTGNKNISLHFAHVK